MMCGELRDIELRLGYAETVVVTRDELNAIDAALVGAADLYHALKEFSALEVKGHALIDRLQFSEEGRALAQKITAALADAESAYELAQSEIEELESYKKWERLCNLCRRVIEGLIECIDDEGVVIPGEKALLAQRVKSAVIIINNLEA